MSNEGIGKAETAAAGGIEREGGSGEAELREHGNDPPGLSLSKNQLKKLAKGKVSALCVGAVAPGYACVGTLV
jgi:hypothetical protein